MYNDKTAKLVTESGKITLLDAISALIEKDIDIVKEYYKYHEEYPKLTDVKDVKKFTIFERKYKIIKLLKKQ